MAESIDESFRRKFFLLAVAVALVNTGFGIIFPVFPKLLVQIGGGNASDLGNLAAGFGIAFIIGSPIFGNFADRIGKRRIILFGLLGYSFANFIYIFATHIIHLYIARVLEGFFASAILPPAIALTAELSPKENRARYLGLLGASQTTGIIIGPVIGGLLFDGFSLGAIHIAGSLSLPFYASATMGFLAFSWSYFQLPNSKIRITESPIANETSIKNKFSGTIRHQIRVLPKPLKMFFLFVFTEMLAILAWLTIEPGFVFYFYDELDLSPTDFGIFVGAFGVVSVLGQSLLGNLSDKFGRKPVIVIGQAFSFLFYALLLQATTLLSLILSVLFVGVGSGLRDPALKAWLSDVTDEENRATVFGIESGLMNTSQVIGPIIGGYLYVISGMTFLFYIAIAINVVNIFLLSRLWFDEQGDALIVKAKEIVPDQVVESSMMVKGN